MTTSSASLYEDDDGDGASADLPTGLTSEYDAHIAPRVAPSALRDVVRERLRAHLREAHVDMLHMRIDFVERRASRARAVAERTESTQSVSATRLDAPPPMLRRSARKVRRWLGGQTWQALDEATRCSVESTPAIRETVRSAAAAAAVDVRTSHVEEEEDDTLREVEELSAASSAASRASDEAAAAVTVRVVSRAVATESADEDARAMAAAAGCGCVSEAEDDAGGAVVSKRVQIGGQLVHSRY